MSTFDIVAILVALAALCSFLNYRFLRLHTTIGVMLIALGLSVALVLFSDLLGHGAIKPLARRLLDQIDFNEAVLGWMLGFLLFAGALTVDVGELARQRAAVGLLATAGTAASMFIVGFLAYFGVHAVGLARPPLINCMLLGALISPTDPVAVLGIMRTAGAPKSIETKLAGESLFNDGMGVVLFLSLLAVAHGEVPVGIGSVGLLLARQILGGALVGFCCGAVVYRMLRQVDNYKVEVLLTIALAMGGYALARALGTSAPIAAVVSGLLIGNRGSAFAMSERPRHNVRLFWELIDDVLNAVLFLLLGLEVVVMPFDHRYLLAVLLMIPIVLAARWLSVAAAITALCRGPRPRPDRFPRGTIAVLTWGGLRGGLAVAMALALPPGPHRNPLLAITYGVVIFSIAVQGTTIGAVVRRCMGTPSVKRET
jgi:CPA1 family monovalent cation:H+ antiporter